VKQVFSECGTVQRVILQQKPTSGPSPNSLAAGESLFTALAQHVVRSMQIHSCLSLTNSRL